jgi:hypothetical protein
MSDDDDEDTTNDHERWLMIRPPHRTRIGSEYQVSNLPNPNYGNPRIVEPSGGVVRRSVS